MSYRQTGDITENTEIRNMKEVKILLTGAAGRMGRAVTELAAKQSGASIVCAVDVTPMQGTFPCYAGINEVPDDCGADVIVDFSHHTAVEGILRFSERTGIPAVICTTGHTADEIKLMEKSSEKIAIFRSGNMSLGINLLMALTEKAAAVLNGFDIEIIEKHHNQKLDAPSGTAIMLADSAEKGRGGKAVLVYDRHMRRERRKESEIGMHSVRGGTIVGEHEVIFAGHDEVVTLAHSAQSREVFAKGALSAAAFMKGKTSGLYNMKDVIDSLIGE